MRDTLIAGGLAIVIVAVGMSIFLQNDQTTSSASPSVAQEALPADVSFTEITKGMQSKVSKATNYLITSDEQLVELWKLIEVKGKVPAIDFNKDSVIAVFAGQKMTGGYGISVMKVTDSTERLVTVGFTLPGKECITTQSIIAPYQVVRIPKTDLSFTHKDQVTTTDCSQ